MGTGTEKTFNPNELSFAEGLERVAPEQGDPAPRIADA